MSRDPHTLTIGQLAKTAGVPITTLRYYERAGLLKPGARTPGSFRAYSEASLERLRFIRSAQALGLTLNDVANLVQLSDEKVQPCAEVQAVLGERLIEINRRLEEIKSVKTAVESALRACRCGPDSGLCSDIKKLSKP